ncbi:MAG: hypothetical protein AAFN77_06700 [Planctomycetota bacterium]
MIPDCALRLVPTRQPVRASYLLPFFTALIAMILSAPLDLHADVRVSRKENKERVIIQEYRFRVTPAKTTRPAFQYRLTVPPHQTIPGNAITHYLRSDGEGSLRRPIDYARETYGDVIFKWASLETPTDDIKLDDLRAVSSSFESFVQQHLRRATFCRDSDWGLALEDLSGKETYEFLLPSVQQTRTMARILQMRNRLAVIEGRHEDSVEHLRMTYQLAHRVGDLGLLVSGLVAISETSMANQGMMHLISSKNGPNMYWALSELPQPVIDLRSAFQLEAGMALRYFDELDGIESDQLTNAEWKAKLNRTIVQWVELYEMIGYRSSEPMKKLTPAITVGMALVSYPQAKQRLIESGLDAETVETMPVPKVILLDAKRELTAYSDEVNKAYCLPFQQYQTVDSEVQEELRASATKNLGAAMANLILPASQQVRRAQARTQAEVNALIIVESIRNHYAMTGSVPKTLDELKLPTRENPLTGKPFGYTVNNNEAVIDFEVGVPYRSKYVIEFID